MLRRFTPLLLLGLLTACTDASPVTLPVAPTAASPVVPSPSVASPSAARPAPPAAGDVVLAVGGGARLALHRLRARSVKAERVRPLVPPRPDVTLVDVSLSAGPTPTTCAVWDLTPGTGKRFQLRCYGWGDSDGAAVRAAGSDAIAVAVSANGRSLAWSNSQLNPTLRIGRLAQGQVTGVKTYIGDPNLPPGNDPARSFSGRGPSELAWAGTDTLAITVQGESDEGSGLRRFVPGSTEGGWLYEFDVPPPDAELQRGYGVYDGVRSATSTTAWALERTQGVGGSDRAPAQRAVEISLPTGSIKRLISEPAEGREVVEVSGGVRAVVYVTAARAVGKERRVYVRYPGQPRGAVVSGLPDSRLVVAAA